MRAVRQGRNQIAGKDDFQRTKISSLQRQTAKNRQFRRQHYSYVTQN